jgi:hypothetical protein
VEDNFNVPSVLSEELIGELERLLLFLCGLCIPAHLLLLSELLHRAYPLLKELKPELPKLPHYISRQEIRRTSLLHQLRQLICNDLTILRVIVILEVPHQMVNHEPDLHNAGVIQGIHILVILRPWASVIVRVLFKVVEDVVVVVLLPVELGIAHVDRVKVFLEDRDIEGSDHARDDVIIGAAFKKAEDCDHAFVL